MLHHLTNATNPIIIALEITQRERKRIHKLIKQVMKGADTWPPLSHAPEKLTVLCIECAKADVIRLCERKSTELVAIEDEATLNQRPKTLRHLNLADHQAIESSNQAREAKFIDSIESVAKKRPGVDIAVVVGLAHAQWVEDGLTLKGLRSKVVGGFYTDSQKIGKAISDGKLARTAILNFVAGNSIKVPCSVDSYLVGLEIQKPIDEVFSEFRQRLRQQ